MSMGIGFRLAAGNQLRLNLSDASYPYWLLQCVQPGPPTGLPDKLQLEQLGDIDA